MKDIEILQHVINGVQIEILNYKSDYVGIQYAKANGYYYIGKDLYITYEGGSTGKSLNDCRLVLRPLSDLTEQIEWDDGVYQMTDEDYFDIDDISNRELQDFLKRHFDVFGLIESGLAIDINSLK